MNNKRYENDCVSYLHRQTVIQLLQRLGMGFPLNSDVSMIFDMTTEAITYFHCLRLLTRISSIGSVRRSTSYPLA